MKIKIYLKCIIFLFFFILNTLYYDIRYNKMRICYISDLHLEFRDEYFDINNEADILILSGDIGNPYEDIYINFLI